MAVSSPRRGRRGDERRRRNAGPQLQVLKNVCIVSGCREVAVSACRHCDRPVCGRHSGVIRGQSGQRGRSSAAGMQAAGGAGRCAQCRLEERRRNQVSVRRIWWAISAAGFVMIAAFAVKSNARMGIALLVLVVAVLVCAYFYDRSLRRS